jgi:hypothetical protein
MEQISNEFIIRALHCDGYEHAGFISSAASALLLYLANPSCRSSPGLLRRSMSKGLEKSKFPVRRKKVHGKHLPVASQVQ